MTPEVYDALRAALVHFPPSERDPAPDQGCFEDGGEVVRSVYMPDSVDAVLGGAAT